MRVQSIGVSNSNYQNQQKTNFGGIIVKLKEGLPLPDYLKRLSMTDFLFTNSQKFDVNTQELMDYSKSRRDNMVDRFFNEFELNDLLKLIANKEGRWKITSLFDEYWNKAKDYKSKGLLSNSEIKQMITNDK